MTIDRQLLSLSAALRRRWCPPWTRRRIAIELANLAAPVAEVIRAEAKLRRALDELAEDERESVRAVMSSAATGRLVRLRPPAVVFDFTSKGAAR